jgi:cardiolipin synthase
MRAVNVSVSASVPKVAPVSKPVVDDAPIGATAAGAGIAAAAADVPIVPGAAAAADAPLFSEPAITTRTPEEEALLPPVGTPDAVGSKGDWKLWNEDTTTRAVVDAIDGAHHVVTAEFFGIADSGKGAHIVDALERAGKRGVEVNVLADSISLTAIPFGSFNKMKDRLEAVGGTVKTNFRIPLVKTNKDTPALQNVDHRKVVTVDGTNAFVGGINFIKLEDGFHDSMLQLSGPAAARLSAEELDRWGRAGGPVTPVHQASVAQAMQGLKLIPDDPNEMRIVANAPEQGRNELTDGYRELIRNAKQRIWVSSPGFSDQELMQDLDDAAARGVDVRVVAPGKAPLNIPIIKWVGDSHLRKLVDEGAKAFAIPEVLHRKSLIADDEVIFSSFNLTGRSKTEDHEIGVRTKDPEFVQAVGDVLLKDMARGAAITHDTGKGVGRKVGDLFAQKWKLNY